MIETRHMGTHLRVLSGGFPMNTNMTGFRYGLQSILGERKFVDSPMAMFRVSSKEPMTLLAAQVYA